MNLRISFKREHEFRGKTFFWGVPSNAQHPDLTKNGVAYMIGKDSPLPLNAFDKYIYLNSEIKLGECETFNLED